MATLHVKMTVYGLFNVYKDVVLHSISITEEPLFSLARLKQSRLHSSLAHRLLLGYNILYILYQMYSLKLAL